MKPIDQLDSDIEAAMRAGERNKLSVLRMAKNALKNEAIYTGNRSPAMMR